MATGYHAAISAEVEQGDTVAVVGDGAVVLSGVLSAKLLGASRIIVLGSTHQDRHALAREWGATDMAYQPLLLQAVPDGSINPGKVFDLRIDLGHIADGYAAMDERRAIKALVKVSELKETA